MNRRWLSVVLLLGATIAFGARLSFEEQAAVQESLSRVHPRMRARWLRERGLDDSYYTTFHRPESSGLRCVGRWPWGPSWELTGRDTFLYLGSGSGVRILSIADSVHPRMLGQINARSLVSQVVVQDSLLFVACGSWGAQIYSVADPDDPRELGSMDAVIGDLCVKDTFCYTIGGGSLRIYDCADPTQPTQVGAVSDGGDVIAEANGYVYVGHGSSGSGLNVYDVRNPSSPALVNTLGGVQLSLFVHGQMLFRTSVQPSYMQILNISNPSSIYEVGRIDGHGGIGLYADDDFAYLSCAYDHQGIFVIDVTNPANPQLRDSLNPEGTDNWDPYVPVPLSYGYLASDYGGLVTVDMHNVNSIFEAWSGYKADQSIDIAVDGTRAYVADNESGMQILDVSDPASPASLGLFDTVGARYTYTATARDSFAFIGISGIPGRKSLRVLDVLDPSNPTLVAQESCFNPPRDMILRDSFIYLAEPNRFQIVNVARPREPVLVGSCVSTDGTYFGLAVQDTLAYVAGGTSLQIVSISDPSRPYVVGGGGRPSTGIAIRDTFAYVPYPYDTLFVYSVADPARLQMVSATPAGVWPWDVALAESVVAVATSDGLEAFSLDDTGQPHWRAEIVTPYGPRRVVYSPPYFYAAMWEAGVGIYRAESLGLQEEAGPSLPFTNTRVRPNPVGVRGIVWIDGAKGEVRLRDVSGRVVAAAVMKNNVDQRRSLYLSKLASGVYFVEVQSDRRVSSVKLVKQ